MVRYWTGPAAQAIITRDGAAPLYPRERGGIIGSFGIDMNLDHLLYRILRRARIQPYLQWHTSKHVNDRAVTIPLLGGDMGSAALLDRPGWKRDLFLGLSRSLPIPQLIDVGANEGQTILAMIECGLGSTPVIAFEPNPACAHFLCLLVRENDWAHVSVIPSALSASAGCVVFETRSLNDTGGSIVPDLRPGLATPTRSFVPCLALDQLDSSGSIDLAPSFVLKIDVEGSELEVLQGSIQTLRDKRPLVVCEVLWAQRADRVDFMRQRNAQLMRLLEESNYTAFRLVLSSGQDRLLGIEPVICFPDGIFSASNSHECDYAFVPGERILGVRAALEAYCAET